MKKDALTKAVSSFLVSALPTNTKGGRELIPAAMAKCYNSLRNQVIAVGGELPSTFPPEIIIQKLSPAEWTQTTYKTLHDYLQRLQGHLKRTD